MLKISKQLAYLSLQAEYDQESANPLWDKSHVEDNTVVSPCCKAPVETAISCSICLHCGSDVQPDQLVLRDPEEDFFADDYLDYND
jgi:hypothetical protein